MHRYVQDEFLKRIQMRKIKSERKENLESNFNYLIMMIDTRKSTQIKSFVDPISLFFFFFFYNFYFELTWLVDYD